jgi:hypothetical protein
MKSLFYLLIVFLVSSCGGAKDKTELKFFTVAIKDFTPYVNQKNAPARPDLTADKVIINSEYPIEISLYQDKKWFYELANLGTGFGTWKFEDGVLKLTTEREILGIKRNMNIDVEAISEGAADLAIKFRDRFGPRILEMEKKNISL